MVELNEQLLSILVNLQQYRYVYNRFNNEQEQMTYMAALRYSECIFTLGTRQLEEEINKTTKEVYDDSYGGKTEG